MCMELSIWGFGHAFSRDAKGSPVCYDSMLAVISVTRPEVQVHLTRHFFHWHGRCHDALIHPDEGPDRALAFYCLLQVPQLLPNSTLQYFLQHPRQRQRGACIASHAMRVRYTVSYNLQRGAVDGQEYCCHRLTGHSTSALVTQPAQAHHEGSQSAATSSHKYPGIIWHTHTPDKRS